jgi:hypothetical protein
MSSPESASSDDAEFQGFGNPELAIVSINGKLYEDHRYPVFPEGEKLGNFKPSLSQTDWFERYNIMLQKQLDRGIVKREIIIEDLERIKEKSELEKILGFPISRQDYRFYKAIEEAGRESRKGINVLKPSEIQSIHIDEGIERKTMLELNLSYEQSKKIKELGYDFSSICYECQNEDDFEPRRLDINDTPEGVPIIPEAALEKCLPDYTRYESDFTWAGHTSISLKYGTGEDLTIENYTTQYESGYEAFLWCHEKYPEELKAKFNKVMGL